MFPHPGVAFSSISPARSGWIAPGRIGFMSTQRRENRPTQVTESHRGGPFRRQSLYRTTDRKERANGSAKDGQIPVARFGDSNAGGTTAADTRSHKLSAIGSPQYSTGSACSFNHVPRIALLTAWRRMHQAVPFASPGYSEYFSPSLPARLHPILPRVTAAYRCRTERYDGKRDLYIQHAA
jgi:hypothetical protein